MIQVDCYILCHEEVIGMDYLDIYGLLGTIIGPIGFRVLRSTTSTGCQATYTGCTGYAGGGRTCALLAAEGQGARHDWDYVLPGLPGHDCQPL